MKVKDIIDPLLELLRDTNEAERLLDHNDSQFARRAYIRSLFAYIEGATWLLKQACLNVALLRGHLTISERALLSDASYELKANGDPTIRQKFLKLEENIRFADKVAKKCFRSRVQIGVGTEAWEKFLLAMKIRHRITHPKNSIEYQVADADIAVCKEVSEWFNSVSHGYVTAIIECSSEKSAERGAAPDAQNDAPR